MIDPGTLRYQIDIQRKTYTVDAGGGRIPAANPTTWTTVWAAIEPISAREVELVKMLTVQASFRFTIYYLEGLLPTDRIKWGDRYFNIISILPNEAMRDVMRLLCSEVQS